jgi:hypothetical protein
LQEKIRNLMERAVGEVEVEEVTRKLEKATNLLGKANKAMEVLEQKVMEKWGHPNQRILGHIICSPSITLGAGTEGFTEYYAIVELDRSKIKSSVGNVIDFNLSHQGYLP